MQSVTDRRTQWAILVGVAALIAAVLIYALSSDVIWAIVPLLLAVAIVRRVMRRGGVNH